MIYMSDYKFLIIPFLVTLVSQFIKCLLDKERRGGIFTFLDLSGGMPSSHSAFVSSLTTCIFFKYGVKSPVFAMCLAFSLIILYDARMVRYESGKQAIVLNEIIKRDGIKKDFILKEKIGHTPTQVLCGTLLGVVLGSILYFVF